MKTFQELQPDDRFWKAKFYLSSYDNHVKFTYDDIEELIVRKRISESGDDLSSLEFINLQDKPSFDRKFCINSENKNLSVTSLCNITLYDDFLDVYVTDKSLFKEFLTEKLNESLNECYEKLQNLNKELDELLEIKQNYLNKNEKENNN